LINISPAYRGLDLFSCKIESVSGLDLTPVCHAWIASVVLSWILFVICSIIMIFTLRASRERFKTEKYEQKLAELDELPAPQVITIPEVQQSAESEQDVPQQQTQLLLQSGLPDQGIPLQIVLPQIAPQVISIILTKDSDDSTDSTDSTNSNFLIIPSQPRSETSSLHEVPL
ncbi:15581_t:CDS:2, partial [Racocetra persica]